MLEENVGSHTDEMEQANPHLSEAMEAFGIEPKEQENEQNQSENKEEQKEAPAIEPTVKKVKFNKEEVEVDISTDEKLEDHLQRSLALDKERERKTELEKNLDRVAMLQGFKDHKDLIANLDRIEQEKQKQEEDAYKELRQSLREEFEDAGLDPDKADAYLDNHPLIKQAQADLAKSAEMRKQEEQQARLQENTAKWQALYAKYPDLVESSKAFDEGSTPDWFTPEMKSRIDRGYDPTDAYELAHRDKIQEKTKKAAEQKVIKEQHLGLRSQVETSSPADNEPSVPEELTSAFSAFGLPPSAAKKYVK